MCIHTAFFIDDKGCESVNLDVSELMFYFMSETVDQSCKHRLIQTLVHQTVSELQVATYWPKLLLSGCLLLCVKCNPFIL